MTASMLVDLYLRLSVDRDGKDSLERQEEDLTAWAAEQGLTIRKVWRDAGKSGFKKDVIRADFDNAVKALVAGEVGTLAVWKLDRLSRRGAGQVGKIIDDIEDVGGRIYFYRDRLDTSDSTHRTLIILVSEQARTESANTSLRVRDKIAKNAAKGLPKGGTRAFGYEKDGITLRDSEATLIRDAVADVLAGRRSMLKVAQDWTEAGALTDGMTRQRRGRDGVKRAALPRWTATTVRQVLLRERNAGILVHDGAVMTNSLIQPIVTVEEHSELQARIKLGTPVGARAKTLLGGVLHCECGQPMHGTVSYSQRKGGPRNVYRIYKCAATLYDKSRRHASIQCKIADDLMTAFVLTDLYKGDLSSPDADDIGRALKRVMSHLAEVEVNIAHVGRTLLDVGLASIHGQARAELQALEIQRSELEAQRDTLMSRTAEGGALAAFMEEWRNGSEGFSDQAEFEEWNARFWEVWTGVSLERKQSMIRARYRPVVKVGGRGVGRIQPNPVDPSTFGKPLEGALWETVDHTDPANWTWEE